MNAARSELILPEGRVEDWTYPNGDHGWMGEFSDNSVCGVVSERHPSRNYVDYRDPSGNQVEPPRERHQMTQRDLLVAMYAATHQKRTEDLS